MWLRWVVSNLLNQMAEDKVRQVMERARHAVEPRVRRQLQPQDTSAPGEAPTDGVAEPPAKSDVVVLFALALESGGLVDRMTDVVTTHCATFTERAGLLEGRRLVVCESGVGYSAAVQATDDLIQVYRPQWVLSAGFAAALTPTLRRGHMVMADSIADEQGESLEVGLQLDRAVTQQTPSLHVGRLLTVDRLVRRREEKERLAIAHDAIACDMETMAVAQACQRQQVRFLSVRIISDQLDDRLPAEVEHMLDQQSVAGKIGAVTRALFRRPGAVKDMWKLQETAVRASDRLARFLVGVLPQLEDTSPT